MIAKNQISGQMKKTIVLYSLAIAAAAFALQWLEYQYAVRFFSTEIYIVLIAVAFTILGIWVGNRLTRKGEGAPFEKNTQAIEYLGISDREYEVLELLAKGCSTKEIGKNLHVSPNTIKSHLARLYEKLDVSRRTQAIHKAKSLNIIG